MLTYVTDPADPSPDRLEYRSGDGPSLHSPRQIQTMSRNFDRFVSIVSRAEDILSQIDWEEVVHIVWEGLKGFVALVVLVALYTVEGVKAFYSWAQPRLACLLQHPQQTIKNGPALVITEAWESVAENNATPAQFFIVKTHMRAFHYKELLTAKVSIIRQSLTVGNIIAWAKVQLMA